MTSQLLFSTPLLQESIGQVSKFLTTGTNSTSPVQEAFFPKPLYDRERPPSLLMTLFDSCCAIIELVVIKERRLSNCKRGEWDTRLSSRFQKCVLCMSKLEAFHFVGYDEYHSHNPAALLRNHKSTLREVDLKGRTLARWWYHGRRYQLLSPFWQRVGVSAQFGDSG